MPAWKRRADGRCSVVDGRKGGSDLRSRHRRSEPAGKIEKRYSRRRRIRKRSDFLRLQRGQRGRRTRHFIVIAAAGPEQDCRLGITVSRRIGSAVVRNRVKRLVREFFRLHRHELQPAHDLLVIARTDADKLSYRDVESQLVEALGELRG